MKIVCRYSCSFTRLLVVSIIVFSLSACALSSANPESELWGTWVFEGNQGGDSFFQDRLTFHEDGRLVLDGHDDTQAQYVVIASGRIKITHNGEAIVYNYEIIDGELQFSLDGNVQAFRKANSSVMVAQNTEDSPSIFSVSDTPVPTLTEMKIMVQLSPTNTAIPPTATLTLTPTLAPPTLTPTISLADRYIDFQVNASDGMPMVFVPAGGFIMGSNEDEDPYFWGAEGPEHEVYVDAFWIYQTEVTNAMYQACVADQACPKPLRNESRTVEDYYINEKYADYPVIQVNWVDAAAYCVWAGGRLPIEAEWEKAARGTEGAMFPWGNGFLEAGYASFCGSRCPGYEREHFDDGYYEIAPVGEFPAGASPYGALDMAGNVWEWVFDYFNKEYYLASPDENPRGPLSGSRRVIKGGSWFNPVSGLRPAARTSMPPQDGLDTLGFRCVLDDGQ
ncbi:MAG: formylglycine-generating enzyme family protein [Brevefilum sp.]|nr:formylglycine-generating enzyme family protein [Brevefilum sp.]